MDHGDVVFAAAESRSFSWSGNLFLGGGHLILSGPALNAAHVKDWHVLSGHHHHDALFLKFFLGQFVVDAFRNQPGIGFRAHVGQAAAMFTNIR